MAPSGAVRWLAIFVTLSSLSFSPSLGGVGHSVIQSPPAPLATPPTSPVAGGPNGDGILHDASSGGPRGIESVPQSRVNLIGSAASTRRVTSTLDLYSGNLLGGNTAPSNWTARGPSVRLSLDSRDGVLLASGAHGNMLVNISTGAILRTYSAGAQQGGFGFRQSAYDPTLDAFLLPWFEQHAVLVISPITGAVLKSINVTGSPSGVAYDTWTDLAYIVNRGSWNVTVLNVSSGRSTASIPLCCNQSTATFDPTTGDVYVLQGGAGTITVINGTTNRIVANVSDPACPDDVAADSRNGQVFVANACYQNVTIINGSTHRYVGSVVVNGICSGIAYDDANGFLYVSDYSAAAITVINGSSDLRLPSLIATSENLNGLQYDDLTGNLYATDSSSVRFLVVHLLAANATTHLGSRALKPSSAAVDQPGDRLFIANAGTDNVSVMNLSTDRLVGSIPVGRQPIGALFDPKNDRLYVADGLSRAITAVNASTGRWARTFYLNETPTEMTLDSATGRVLVLTAGTIATGYSAHIAVIDPVRDRLSAWISVGQSGSGIAFDPQTDNIFVSHLYAYGTGALTIVNGSTLKVVSSLYTDPLDSFISIAYDDTTGQIALAGYLGWNVTYNLTIVSGRNGSMFETFPIGMEAADLTFDSANGYFYVTSTFAHNVTALDATSEKVVGPVTVGFGPDAIAFDGSSGQLYVLDGREGAVSII